MLRSKQPSKLNFDFIMRLEAGENFGKVVFY
jgi:hypothetical protein